MVTCGRVRTWVDAVISMWICGVDEGQCGRAWARGGSVVHLRTHVCVCMYKAVLTFVCQYLCLLTCAHVYVSADVSLCSRLFMCVCIFPHEPAWVCMYIAVSARFCAYPSVSEQATFAWLFPSISGCVCECLHVSACAPRWPHVYMCHSISRTVPTRVFMYVWTMIVVRPMP